MKMRKVFVFTRKPPYVEQIPFKNLHKGNIFYTEEKDGELTVDPLSTQFLYRCKTCANGVPLGRFLNSTKPEKRKFKNWGVQIESVKLSDCVI